MVGKVNIILGFSLNIYSTTKQKSECNVYRALSISEGMVVIPITIYYNKRQCKILLLKHYCKSVNSNVPKLSVGIKIIYYSFSLITQFD